MPRPPVSKPKVEDPREYQIDSLLKMGIEAVERGQLVEASRIYRQIREVYERLPHEEKHELHGDIMNFYYAYMALYRRQA